MSDCKQKLLSNAGVKLSKDQKCVFTYNPLHFGSGLNWALVWTVLPNLTSRNLWIQYLVLVGAMHIWRAATPIGPLDTMASMCYNNIAQLSRFVLGLYVSLLLSKTYYANRGQFGILFGRNLGFAQMVASWVKAPDSDAEGMEQAAQMRELLVRWANASFRLMWLETWQNDKDAMGADMVDSTQLLNKAEWEFLKDTVSRCTHIYTWMTNVLHMLYEKGFIQHAGLMKHMHTQLDEMRGANVWGLPSLPLPYTMMVVIMVKIHLFFLALSSGSMMKTAFESLIGDGQDMAMEKMGGDKINPWMGIIIVHTDLCLHNFFYQGLVDLHGLLYNPNQGLLLGHLPVVNFLGFVKLVSEDLIRKSQCQSKELPYAIGLKQLQVAKTARNRDSIPTAPKMQGDDLLVTPALPIFKEQTTI